MARKMISIVISILFLIPLVLSDDATPIPADKSQLETWFKQNVKPLADRKSTLDPALVEAEASPKVVKVKSDGSGDFKTITDAIKSIPKHNKNRVIISIGGGKYTEKIKIERDKPFITFYGDPKDMPTLAFGGTAAKYTVVESGTLTVDSDYFSAVNIIIMNTAPRPDGKMVLAQAAAMRIGGDKAAFYNCKFNGFQDTLCDDKGKHFFKNCYIEGTVDFIWGGGKSLYLNVEAHVIPGDPMAMITAQARENQAHDLGYSFVHCNITGGGPATASLGRAWKAFAKVVFAYTEMGDVVKPEGWSNNGHPEYDKNLFFGEYNNKGPGAELSKRVSFVKKLTEKEVKPFISLAYIEGSKWLLPPPTV